jgi:proton-coupled amino acid transporter
MPYAFKNGGVWLGLVALLIIALITMHCVALLIKCKRRLIQQLKQKNRQEGLPTHDIEKQVNTYGDVGRMTMGPAGTIITSMLLVFTQCGFCCAYLIFIGENMHDMLPGLPNWLYICFALVLLLPICLLRNLKYLAFFSLISEFMLLLGMGIVIYFDIHNLSTQPFPGDRSIKTHDFLNFPVFFGITIFGFEGIGLALPVEANMKNKHSFNRVLYIAETIVAVMMAGFGVIGYLAYGRTVQAIITLNMPAENPTTYVIKVGLIIALLFTYPMQLFPVSELFDDFLAIIRRKISKKDLSEEEQLLREEQDVHWVKKLLTSTTFHIENTVRIVTLIVTALLAISIPDFGDFLSIIGGLGGTLLAFVLPCIIHIIVCRKEVSWAVIAKDVAITTFGIVASAITTYMSVAHIVESFNKSLR